MQSSSTSSKNLSPLRQPVSLRRGGSSLPRSRTTRVIPDSDDDADDGFDGPIPVSKRTRTRASGTLEVVIPTKQDEAPTDSSRSSLGITSADGATGLSTPATSVGGAAESDNQKPRKRVNASERVARLQSNTTTRRTSLRGTKRSAAAMETDQEATDEALARALQLKEYGEPRPKKQRIGFEDIQDSARRLADRLDAMPPDTELSESELSDRITPVETEEEVVYQPSVSDSENEFFSATEERENPRLRLAFPPEFYADEDEELPTWEEQRKIRRVSLYAWTSSIQSLTFFLDASRSEETGEKAPDHSYNVG